MFHVEHCSIIRPNNNLFNIALAKAGLMLSLNKIFALGITLSVLTMWPICSYGHGKAKHPRKKHKNELTFGFRTGKSVLYRNTVNSTKQKNSYLCTNSFVLSMPLSNHFRVETGIGYNILNSLNTQTNGSILTKPNSINVPVTIQYYFLPEKQRLPLLRDRVSI